MILEIRSFRNDGDGNRRSARARRQMRRKRPPNPPRGGRQRQPRSAFAATTSSCNEFSMVLPFVVLLLTVASTTLRPSTTVPAPASASASAPSGLERGMLSRPHRQHRTRRGTVPSTAFVLPTASTTTTTTTTTGRARRDQRETDDPSSSRRIKKTARLHMSGRGIASNYTWNEEAFEIDVTVRVPSGTKAKDIIFQATTTSIDLRLQDPNNQETVVLLDKTRKLRGRVNVDGTYWVISDASSKDSKTQSSEKTREVTVTIEKLISTPKDDFEVVDYDWKGLYSNEYDDEIVFRQYDEPEVLNVREYAASLGVDIDNIDMSMVDKTMFTSGLNLTQSTYDELQKAGLVKEVTQQADGREFVVSDDDDGDDDPAATDNADAPTARTVPFSPLGEAIGREELPDTMKLKGSSTTRMERTLAQSLASQSSPWQSAVPVDGVDYAANRTFVRNFTRAAFAGEGGTAPAAEAAAAVDTAGAAATATAATDPIDALTVQRLKEILKSQGMKVTGSKKELQDRLRRKVNSLLQGGSISGSGSSTGDGSDDAS